MRLQARRPTTWAEPPAQTPSPGAWACTSRFGPKLVSACGAPSALDLGVQASYAAWLRQRCLAATAANATTDASAVNASALTSTGFGGDDAIRAAACDLQQQPSYGVDPVFLPSSDVYDSVLAKRAQDWYDAASPASSEVSFVGYPFGFAPVDLGDPCESWPRRLRTCALATDVRLESSVWRARAPPADDPGSYTVVLSTDLPEPRWPDVMAWVQQGRFLDRLRSRALTAQVRRLPLCAALARRPEVSTVTRWSAGTTLFRAQVAVFSAMRQSFALWQAVFTWTDAGAVVAKLTLHTLPVPGLAAARWGSAGTPGSTSQRRVSGCDGARASSA